MTPLRRTWLTSILVAAFAVVAAAQEELFVVTVNNTNNVTNGDISNIPALNATPGPDGISFIEAFTAANGTGGMKRIVFGQEVAGRTIDVTSSADQRQLFVIDTPDITIDGDSDNDGRQDVMLFGARDSTVAFLIRASRTTIHGLKIAVNFPGSAFYIGCADTQCDRSQVSGVEISGNEITNVQGSGIVVGPEAVRPADLPYLSNLVIENVLISRNTIIAGEVAVSITPSVDALSGAVARGIRIENNTIAAVNGVRAISAHRFSPPLFGEANLIQNLTIDANTFTVTGSAIRVTAADYGNANNRVSGVGITNNRIERSANGIEVATAVEGKAQRASSGNVVENVTIASNDIHATTRGISVSGADLPQTGSEAVGFDSNRVENVSIRDNTIADYREAGVQLWGGYANGSPFTLTVSRNVLQDVRVTNNALAAGAKSATGIFAIAGDARSGSTARDNAIRALTIAGNRASGNGTAVWLVGGMGGLARNNTIDVTSLGGNILLSNDATIVATENMNSAAGNAIRFPRRRAVR